MRWHERYGLRWLSPGLRIKRWLMLLLAGVTALALALALVLRHLYIGGYRFPPFVYYLTLQFIPRPARAALLGVLGLALIVLALLKLNDALLSTLLPARQPRPNLADLVYRRRQSQRGPRVVAIGGGHGLSTLLSGLKLYTDHITAIVNVADDGGSSGRIRRDFGILPPGDIRRCLAALSEAEPLMAALMEHRFSNGEGLEGHTFGNLLITALADHTGSFEEAIRETSRVLAVRGEILPPTLASVTLWAELHGENGEAGRHISGESQIAGGEMPIRRVYLDPPDVPAYTEAVRAILAADLIVIGPGSLYTSILPVLLVPEITRAMRASPCVKAYVCNVATEPGETDHFGVRAHIQALVDHLGSGLFDVALANSNQAPSTNFAPEWRGRTEIVPLDTERISHVRLVTGDIINPDNPLRHDPERLAAQLVSLLATYAQDSRAQAADLALAQ